MIPKNSGSSSGYGTLTADDVSRPLVSLIFWPIDQKMRLTKVQYHTPLEDLEAFSIIWIAVKP